MQHSNDETLEIAIDNGRIAVAFSPIDGTWTRLYIDGRQAINYLSDPVVPADFKIDGEWMVDKHGCRFLGYYIDEKPGETTLLLNYGVEETHERTMVPSAFVRRGHGGAGGFSYILTCTYSVRSESSKLRRKLRVRRMKERDFAGTRVVRFNSFLFRIPGIVLGEAETCVVDMPGPITSSGEIIKPRSAYNDIKKGYHYRKPSPDVDFGVVVLSNPSIDRNLAVWLETTRTMYGCHLSGDGSSIDLLNNEEYPVYLHDGYDTTSHEQVVRFGTGNQGEALRSYSEYIASAAPPFERIPCWIDEAVIMEIAPDFYGGFSGIEGQLGVLHEIGFNTLYLMPLNRGGYWVADHYDVDEDKFGSARELKAMVNKAHELGMHVLLDLLVVMLTDDSPLLGEHPEYFVRDEAGRILPHSQWEFPSTDYANRGFRQYIVEFASYCVREYGVDGFRVDAPNSKSPNWYPHCGHAPWETIMGAYDILHQVNVAIKQINPEAILLDEMGGPICYQVCDIGHNHGCVYRIVNDADVENQVTYSIKDYKNLLCDAQDAMPDGVNRVYYMRNHDTAWFYRFDGYTRRFRAFEAVHCLIKGVPLFFSGQNPGKGAPAHVKQENLWAGPDDEAFAMYQKLFTLRKSNPALIRGACYYEQIDTDNRHVFSALRVLDGQMIIVLVSESPDILSVRITIDSEFTQKYPEPVELRNLYGKGYVKIDTLAEFDIELMGYEIAVFELA